MNFSLVMPIRNGSLYIPSIKTEIEAMMRRGDELVIVDDNSDDSSLRMVQDWAISNPQIRVLSNSNPGLANALNLGIGESTHQFIARVDVDDAYDPMRLNLQEESISDKSVAIFSDYTFHSEENRYLGYMPSAVTPLATSLSLISSSRTAHPSVIFRKDAFNTVGGYRQSDFPCEDLSLWLRLDKVGTLHSIPKPLLKYKMNKSGVSASKRVLMKSVKNDLLQEYGLRNEMRSSALESWEYEISQIDLFSLSNVRKILMLRDLRLAKEQNFLIKNSAFLERVILKDVLFQLTTASNLTRLSYERLLRRFNR